MGNILPYPITSHVVTRHGSETMTMVGVEMQGYRTHMEDAICYSMRLSNLRPDISVFAVFDGHSGALVSDYMAKNLLRELRNLEDPTNPTELDDMILRMDYEICNSTRLRNNGSTCCFAIVRQFTQHDGEQDLSELPFAHSVPFIADYAEHKRKQDKDISEFTDKTRFEVTVVNVGDSRCVLMNADCSQYLPMTRDHKPNLPHEAARIIKAGGHVNMDRVDGQLAMSRAMGDGIFKGPIPGRNVLDQKVIAQPEISRWVVKPGYKILVACDGFYEELDHYQVSSALGNFLEKHKEANDPSLALADLANYSIAKGSHDNHSAMLINISRPDDIVQKTEYNEEGEEVVVEGETVPYGVQFANRFHKGMAKQFIPGEISLRASRSSTFMDEYRTNAVTYGMCSFEEVAAIIEKNNANHESTCLIS